ncbi:MAG: hypothetical protein H5U32_03825 [Pseudomonas balearica]|jgi:hypothetical protein|uniref:hypothetical protein n=1 Tax=Stutzerimonas balearica TaxID=74829 RepID=UPI0019C031BF|nr:hypothetical protein [Stutzerimonas balearica]MBC7198360.1 hypothetical protein [Stutzerimonas balearica]
MQSLITTALSEPLDALREALAAFTQSCSKPGAVIRGERFNAMDGLPEPGEPSELLIEAVSTWDIANESVNGTVTRFPGVFEVSEAVLDSAYSLNRAKLFFSEAVSALESQGVDSRQIRQAYRAAGLPRLHPLQAWREIVVLDGENLTSVGFTVVKGGHSIEVLTVDEARERLRQAKADDVLEQLQALTEQASIHWHVPVCRHIRANVVWQSEGNRAARQYHASLPFLVQEGCWPRKRVRFNQPRDHAQRSDTKGTIYARLPQRQGAYLSVS